MSDPQTQETPKMHPVRARFTFEVRILIMIGLFALAWRLLDMIGSNVKLLDSGAFMIIVGLIIGSGGLGTLVAFYFGASKTGADVMSAQSQSVIQQANKTNPPT